MWVMAKPHAAPRRSDYGTAFYTSKGPFVEVEVRILQSWILVI